MSLAKAEGEHHFRDAHRAGAGRQPLLGKLFLALEGVVLFVGIPAAMQMRLLPVPPLALAGLLALGCAIWLFMDPTFDRKRLWNRAPLKEHAWEIAVLFCCGAAGLLLLLMYIDPARLLELPRNRPGLWVLVLLLYPLLSVYPQELIYRAFFFHRYRPLLGTGWAMVAVNALAFGYMHVLFGNFVAVLLTLVGGWLFAWRYMRSQSLFTVSVEHAIYGQLLFTIGWGFYFFHGSVRTVGG